ncbi:hypothetical protein [Sphingomonas sp. Leaf25]|uniref:hypothetical protein n=1 Tax=Sphingomonas sp. Leaf25 TaxID=1735692 RepID=UPI0006FD3134|nr:hypothetical protein [Sphingomonas sp. Leaf25]KQN05070.1 hypothetical protein ASE78_17015 [Sphingomonas sp. Leaf25]
MNDPREPTAIFRSGPDECAYLRRRAADHRQLAEKSGEAHARSIHLRLAQLYGDRVRLLDLVLPDQHTAQRY